MQLNKLFFALLKMVFKPLTINWSLWWPTFTFLFLYSVLVIDFIILSILILNK